MLVEHVFVTTLEEDAALGWAAEFLRTLGFKFDPAPAHSLLARKGRAHANTRKIALLPQQAVVSFDRGRVSVAAHISPRGGKGHGVHAELMTALAQGLEAVLVHRLPLDQARARWDTILLTRGTLWASADYLGIGCLVVLAAAIVIGIALAVVLH
ncbi:MAG: hypothetical protein PHU85_15255 [Phycisphaerae bacterium]|nr:hypothetical protein [Phycisphaerae bacterium]